MPDTPSITIIKRFTYRDALEEWGNTYHFSGTTPANAAAWKTLADAVIAAERPIVTGSTSFVRAYGYEAGNENSVAQIDYTVPPNAPPLVGSYGTPGTKAPGDAAATIRWWTGVTSSRGKKVYCRKYFHDITMNSSDSDELQSTLITAMNTYAAKMIDGTLPGSFKYCGPQGAVLSDPHVNLYITTRTLKRRGKRPPLPGGP